MLGCYLQLLEVLETGNIIWKLNPLINFEVVFFVKLHFFGPNIFSDQNFFCRPKIFFWTKSLFQPKFFLDTKFLWIKKKISTKNCFWTYNFFAPKILLDNKKIQTKSISGQKKFSDTKFL